jgi:restriction system protein
MTLVENFDNSSSRRALERNLKRLFVCPVCGWWKAEARQEIDDWVHLRGHSVVYGAAASLRELDLSDISTPINDVRSYLAAKYENRFILHPRLFEETVASVFGNLGYTAEATAYSGDDGIDVILKRADETIGIQVKRYRGSVEVEQIRSLAGALLLNGLTRGIFVTTSNFQRGGKTTTEKYAARGYEIELLDAERFYDALKIAQREMYGAFGAPFRLGASCRHPRCAGLPPTTASTARAKMSAGQTGRRWWVSGDGLQTRPR